MLPTLYIIMRQDLLSMNAGKAMAQAAHAANAFVDWVGLPDFDYMPYDGDVVRGFLDWKDSTDQGFGTTIVLGNKIKIGSFSEFVPLQTIVEGADSDGFVAGVVHDPTYPVPDGHAVHYVPVDTCAYVFTPCSDSLSVNALKQLSLHP